MTHKPGLMTRLAPATRLGLGLALAGVSMGAMAQTPQATLADATACVPTEYVEKTAQGETTYYVVCIKQQDGTRKEVRYTKGEGGWIIPPDSNATMLLDGSPLTGNQKLDKARNISIIGKYDKDKQIVLAMTDPGNIVGDATQKMQNFTNKVTTNSPLTRDDLFGMYYAIVIISNANPSDSDGRTSKAYEATDVMATRSKFPPKEIENMKQKAKEEAQRRWREVTGSLD